MGPNGFQYSLVLIGNAFLKLKGAGLLACAAPISLAWPIPVLCIILVHLLSLSPNAVTDPTPSPLCLWHGVLHFSTYHQVVSCELVRGGDAPFFFELSAPSTGPDT